MGVCVFVCVCMCVCVCVCLCVNFQTKQTALTFSAQICPKTGLRVGNSENYCRNKNQHPRDTLYVNLQVKHDSDFFFPNLPKNEFNIVSIFSQNGQTLTFWLKFPQKLLPGVLKIKTEKQFIKTQFTLRFLISSIFFEKAPVAAHRNI